MRRRTLMLATAAFALASPLTAFAVRDHHVRPSFPPPRTTGTPASAPMLAAVMPTVEATINGKGPFKLGIDTGAPDYLSLNEPVAQALALKVTGKGVATDPSGRNPVPITRYGADAIGLCGLAFHNVDVETIPVLGAKAPPFDGVLGMALFSHMLLTLDFKGRSVSVATGALPAADGKTVLDYPPDELIQLPVSVGEVVIPSHLDTGQQIVPYMAPKDFLPRLATRGEARKIGVAHTVSQAYDLFSIGIDAPVKVGAVPLPVTEVGYPTVVPIGNIGSRALAGVSVTVDRANHRVRFQA